MNHSFDFGFIFFSGLWGVIGLLEKKRGDSMFGFFHMYQHFFLFRDLIRRSADTYPFLRLSFIGKMRYPYLTLN